MTLLSLGNYHSIRKTLHCEVRIMESQRNNAPPCVVPIFASTYSIIIIQWFKKVFKCVFSMEGNDPDYHLNPYMQRYVWREVLVPIHMATINKWLTRDNVLFKRQSSESVYSRPRQGEALMAVAADSLTLSLLGTHAAHLCVMWFKRETSGPGSAVHHPRLQLHNSGGLTGRQTVN